MQLSFGTCAISSPLLKNSALRVRLPTVAGRTFAGPVRYMGDGDSLCVGRSANPTSWIAVRLADFDAPELQDPRDARAKAAPPASHAGTAARLPGDARAERARGRV